MPVTETYLYAFNPLPSRVTADPPDRSSEPARSEKSFQSQLAATLSSGNGSPVRHPEFTLLPHDMPMDSIPESMYKTPFPAGYPPVNEEKLTDWEKYKDDQLLSNPGGDHYDLRNNTVHQEEEAPKGFWDRIGKDISDAFDNFKNSAKNLLFGADFRYRDEDNQIQVAKSKGLLGSVGDFFKDMGSALSFGAWRPDGEAEPQGFIKRMGFFYSKIKEAVFGDVVQGVGGSIVKSAESTMLGGWNLLEVIPDASIGNFEEGRKLTTTIFDNGQVAIDYLTDILPTGEAWVRVHSPNFDDLNDAKAPVIYNIQLPERYNGDARWEYVRNTPFRKTIETIGSILADIATVALLGDSSFSSEHRKD
jgi:hypothetical protein